MLLPFASPLQSPKLCRSLSMEIPTSMSICTKLYSASSLCQTPPNYAFNLQQYRHITKKSLTIVTFTCTGRRRRKGRGLVRVLAKNSSLEECSDSYGTVWEQPGVVEVIGIGSRVDSVLDYCLSVSSSSRSLRFWNMIMTDSQGWKLQQRLLNIDKNPDVVEAPLYSQSCHKAVVLVASAGYDDDHTTAIDILRRIRFASGLGVAIILRPFGFEGRRRQDEVRTLLHKIQEFTNFCIEIDINSLLKMDLVTLDEALRTTNRAVFLGISAVAVLISGMHGKHIDYSHNPMAELNVPGIMKVVESYKVGNIGFGVGHSFETSILQAACHCPFLSVRLKDLDGLVICILSSANVDDCKATPTILHTFRQLTEFKQDIMVSVVYDPDLKPNVIATTVLTLSSCNQKLLKKSSLFSKLAEHIPFMFNFLRNSQTELDSPPNIQTMESSSLPASASPANKVLDTVHVATPVEGFEMHSREPETFLSENSDDLYAFREYGHDTCNEASGVQYSDFNAERSTDCEQNANETIAFHREPLLSWEIRLAGKTGHELTKDRAVVGISSPGVDKPSIFHLPVGVRPSSNVQKSSDISNGRLDPQSKTKDTTAEALANPSGSSWNTTADLSAQLNGKYADGYKKHRVLSARAASMLEAERDSGKKWSRVLEIGYRGGIYKGHCQGGLPEGRGRLQLPDGSAYDGMWRYGKRSGLGTFCFSNGDVFQGTWRDDLMHGKGWFYFHNGDRWFSDFWKGRANGEGRFYSKSGEVFYGHFQDGWRHGHFQCVKSDGTRFVEIWEDGVLLHSEQLDFDGSSDSDDKNEIQ